jgi:hypothetical protein
VFTSPPIERSIYFVHHHVLPLSVFIFQEHSSFNELMLRGSPRPLRCSRTLARPPLCSGTRQTTSCSGTLGDSPDHSVLWDFWSDHSALGDFVDHSPTMARGLRCSLLDLRSGTASITLRPRLGDFVDHSPTRARGLCVSTTCDWRLAYSWDILSRLDHATRLIPHLPASSGTTLVRCTCRCISYRLYDGWILNLTRNSF